MTIKTNQKELFFESPTGVFTFQEKQQYKEFLNMAEQRQSGLVGRPQLDALGRFRMAVLPDTKSKSFSEILEGMSDKERNSIESYTKIILRMIMPFSGSYYQQAKRLYPKIVKAKHVLLAELL